MKNNSYHMFLLSFLKMLNISVKFWVQSACAIFISLCLQCFCKEITIFEFPILQHRISRGSSSSTRFFIRYQILQPLHIKLGRIRFFSEVNFFRDDNNPGSFHHFQFTLQIIINIQRIIILLIFIDSIVFGLLILFCSRNSFYIFTFISIFLKLLMRLHILISFLKNFLSFLTLLISAWPIDDLIQFIQIIKYGEFGFRFFLHVFVRAGLCYKIIFRVFFVKYGLAHLIVQLNFELKLRFIQQCILKSINFEAHKVYQFTQHPVRFLMETPIVFKIIVLGQQGVGKSSMLIRYMKGEFSAHYNVTVGVEFASKSVSVDTNKEVKLQIWDTAGQQAFRAIVRSFYKGIAGVFLTFALDNQDTLDALKSWQKEVKQNGHEEIVFFLVGTRADLERSVSGQKIKKVMKQLEAAFFIETSAKTGTNIQQLFTKAADTMYKKYMTNDSYQQLINPSNDRTREKSLALQNRRTIEKKRSCCG